MLLFLAACGLFGGSGSKSVGACVWDGYGCQLQYETPDACPDDGSYYPNTTCEDLGMAVACNPESQGSLWYADACDCDDTCGHGDTN